MHIYINDYHQLSIDISHMIYIYIYFVYHSITQLGPNTSRPVSKTSTDGMLTSLTSSVTAALTGTGSGTGTGGVAYPEKRRRRPSLVREKDMQNKPPSRLV